MTKIAGRDEEVYVINSKFSSGQTYKFWIHERKLESQMESSPGIHLLKVNPMCTSLREKKIAKKVVSCPFFLLQIIFITIMYKVLNFFIDLVMAPQKSNLNIASWIRQLKFPAKFLQFPFVLKPSMYRCLCPW